MTMDIQRVESFQQDQPVILEQPAFWTRAFIWLIVVMTASTLIWAALAKIDHSIPANGKLEPDGSLKELDAPVGGVVKEIHVKGGDRVKKGDLLVTFDPTTSEADVESLTRRKEAVEATKDAIQGGGSVGGSQANLDSLRQRRDALASENEFLRAQVNGGAPGGLVGGAFDANQQQLLEKSRQEAASREKAGQEEINTLQAQLQQTKIQRQALRERLPSDRSALESARARRNSPIAQEASAQQQIERLNQELSSLEQRRRSAEARRNQAEERVRISAERLAKEQEILDRIRPVVEQGAVAELQLNRQEQQVLSVQNELLAGESELARANDEIRANLESQSALQRQQDDLKGAVASRIGEREAIEIDIAEREARISDTENEIDRLGQEELRLQAEIDRAKAQLDNSFDNSDRETLARIAANQQQIAQIDDQLTQQRLNNDQQMAEVTGELKKAEQALAYRELRSPVDGIVFQVSPRSEGYVIGQVEQEPVVSILPNANLKASVEVTNKDIGFIKVGMPVEVQIDAFPATEFGTVPGELTSIGEDVLEPDQIHNYYRFPVTVELKQQYIDIGDEGDKIQVPLKSGMSVRANIKVRERTVLSIFLDKFVSQKEVLKQVR
ncbi:MAG TPA: HlyD family efflux transporter periplasmic adaptor subunit [Oscillatoriales cyanobacterium M4454_W2019_049]|nr:HlyD family efflux transporter periplasmic adaptor subunit [Oscillatoriales cyanobacterium M4454_W2019_049]